MPDPSRSLALLATVTLAMACSGEGVVLTFDTGQGAGGGEVAGGSDGGGEDGGDDGGGDDGGGSDEGYVCINEFMASNGSTLEDDSGAYPDWLELYNDSTVAVDLGGWTITDDLDDPGKHELFDFSLEPGEFLVLFADGDVDQGERHLGFNLSADGEALGIYMPDGTPVDRLTYEAQSQDVAAARMPDGSMDWALTDDASPGESNGDGR